MMREILYGLSSSANLLDEIGVSRNAKNFNIIKNNSGEMDIDQSEHVNDIDLNVEGKTLVFAKKDKQKPLVSPFVSGVVEKKI